MKRRHTIYYGCGNEVLRDHSKDLIDEKRKKMSFDKLWTKYVLHTMDSEQLDKMIINLHCQIEGYHKCNKQKLKGIERSLKIRALNKRACIEQEVMNGIKKLYKPLLGEKELQKYYQMTPTEFTEQIDIFKEKKSKEIQLVVVNYFLQESTTLDIEKEQILKHFTTDKKESGNIQINKNVTEERVQELEPKSVVEKKEQMTKKETKNNLKMLENLNKELKQKEEEQEKENKRLLKEIDNRDKSYKDQEEGYKKELKKLEDSFEQLDKKYKKVKDENKNLAEKLKEKVLGVPYIFIGSQFMKKKLEELKSEQYPEANAIYISTKQWENGLGKQKDEVEEVYIFFYDVEWFVRDKLREQYERKLKIFPEDEFFYNHIENNWEA